ncbi:MAG TPA: hypothetical protein VFK87_05295, partial [Steroidobacteraceae bacterium]|nr:hypothetical protein [Steroidobacteraceae bacterium]
LAPSDTGAAGLAVDLSGNTLWGFVDDIDGQRRQGAWDLGADQRFTPSPPTVTSGIADPLDATRATLNGTALPNFTATRGWFRYAPGALAGCDDTVGLRAPPTGSIALGQNDTTPLSFAQPVAGLMPGTMYSFCAVATNDAGFGFGAVSIFATPADAGAQPDGGAPDGGALDAGPDGGGADGGASDGGSSAPRRELVGCGCRQDGAAALLPLVLLAGRRLRRRAAAAAATP